MSGSARQEGKGGRRDGEEERGANGRRTFSPRPVIRSERAFIVPSVNTTDTEGRGGRGGLSLIVPTVAHEPLKVPYKYGPVSVRRQRPSLSSACGRACT